MSNENKDTLSEIDGLIPDLRFPEFVNDKTWIKDTLGALTNVISTRNKESKNLPVYSINNKEGFLPQGEQFEGISSTERNYDISLYKVIERNTFAYNPARINVGSIGYSGDLDNIIISSLYVCFKTTEKVNDEFLLQFIKTPYFNKEVENNVEGGIRNYLFYQNFSNISIPIPSLEEQQKIASCLSSLDELIAAHNDKLEALKVHKKGLMQSLFPQDGETVPKVRFKEFVKDGEWVEKKMAEVASFLKGKGISKSDIVKDGLLPCIRYGELYTHYHETISYIKSYTNGNSDDLVLSQANDVIIPASGETQIDIATASCVLDAGIALGGDLNIIRTDLNGVFLAYYLNNARKTEIAQMAQGVSVMHLYPSQLKTLALAIPKPLEQQKIASILSALDELLTIQVERIEELKKHKKGLMQGLFPKIED